MTKERFEELMRKGGVTNQADIDGAWEVSSHDSRLSTMEELDSEAAEEAIVKTAQHFVALGLYS